MSTEFEQLLMANRDAVAGYCLRLLNSHTDVDEVVQCVSMRAWRGYSTFRGDSSFLTWVMAIARREVQRCINKRQRDRARFVSFTEAMAESEAMSRDGPGLSASFPVDVCEPTAANQTARIVYAFSPNDVAA